MINYFSEIIDTIKESLDTIDESAFNLLVDECGKVLNDNGKIIVTGLGKNVPICEKFVGTMNSLGLNAAFLHTNSAVHGDIGVVKENDLLIMLSKSGNTSESVYLAKLLKEFGCETWSITFNCDAQINAILNHALILSLKNEGDPWNIMPNNSSTINLIVLQTIAMQLAHKMEIHLSAFKKNHPGGYIGKLLNEKDDV